MSCSSGHGIEARERWAISLDILTAMNTARFIHALQVVRAGEDISAVNRSKRGVIAFQSEGAYSLASNYDTD
jgi:hypothetical protein